MSFLFIPVILFTACRGPVPPGRVSPSVYGESGILAGLSFPPYSHRKQIEFALRSMGELSLDRMRIAVDWKDREPGRALSPARTDPAVSTKGYGKAMWKNCCCAMTILIKNKQFCNEWETGQPDGTAYWEAESIEKFVLYNNILYDRVKRLSPGTRVALGGLTRTNPIEEAYYFRLVDSPLSYHSDSGLYSGSLRAKPAKKVFAAELSAP